MAKPKIDIITELGRFLPGDALERIRDELEDPGASLTSGQLARLGGAATAWGTRMTDAAKDRQVGVQRDMDAEVIFTWTDPSEFWAVDSAEVKKLFPQKDYPALYKRQERTGFVTVNLPFDVK